MLYTQQKENMPIELGPIECEEFNEAFLEKYFHRQKREVQNEEFIIIKQGNVSFEEYSLKFNLLPKYSPYLVSNPKYELSRFLTGFFDIVKEECRAAMLYDNMNLSTLYCVVSIH